jgi:hypothetical protein
MLEHLCGPVDSVMAEMTDLTGRGWLTLAALAHAIIRPFETGTRISTPAL